MSQQINIPIGADTSGFYSELKKAFDWAKREADSVRFGGGGGGFGGSKEGGIGSKVNSSLNNRMPDPTRAGLHELGNGGFIRTFEAQMHTAGYIAIKTQEMFQKASLRGIGNWGSQLGSSLKNIIAPLGGGVMNIARLGGSAISSIGSALPGLPKSRFKGSGIDYSSSYDEGGIPIPTTDPNILSRFYQKFPNPQKQFAYNRIWNKNMGTKYPDTVRNFGTNNSPIDLEPYKRKLQPRDPSSGQFLPLNQNLVPRPVIPTIFPRNPDGSTSEESGSRSGSWRNQPRDSLGRFMSPNSMVDGGSRGYNISSNMVHITANTVYITAGNILQGNSLPNMGGVNGSGGNSLPRPQITGTPPGLARDTLNENRQRTPQSDRKKLKMDNILTAIPADAKVDRTKRPPKDPLAVAGASIASEIFNPRSKEKNDRNENKPSLVDKIKSVAGDAAAGAGRMFSGIKGTAGAVTGAIAASLGIAGIGLAISSAMAGVVSDLGEKYTQQAMKQSDTVGALGGRISGGGGYFVNEEVARANIAQGKITGQDVFGKGNQISQYQMKFASSLGVGISEISGVLAHIRHAEGEAETIDRIRRKGALLGYKNLQLLSFVQKEAEYDQQRTEKGLKSNFNDVLALASGAFKGLEKEGRLGAAQEVAGHVQSRFGANVLSDMILSSKMQESGVSDMSGILDIATSIEKNQAGALIEWLNKTPKSQREGIIGSMYHQGQMSAVQAKALIDYDGTIAGKSSIEKAIGDTKVDPVKALTNFLAGHENRQQAIFLNGIGASAYQMSVDLQKQQMQMVQEHKDGFMKTAEVVNKIQQGMMGATASLIEFTGDVIKNVTEFMKSDTVKNFIENLKKFMDLMSSWGQTIANAANRPGGFK